MIAKKRKLSKRAKQAAKIRDILAVSWFACSDREIAREVGVSNATVSAHRKRMEEAGEILPRLKTAHSNQACYREVFSFAIRPSSGNDLIYDPIQDDDPELLSLMEDIRQNGVLEPILVTEDGHIVSGHRRYRATQLLGMERVPILIQPSLVSGTVEFMHMLASCNRQRVKTTAEAMREQVTLMAEDSTYAVCDYRLQASRLNESIACNEYGYNFITLRGEKKRSEIVQKLGLMKAIIGVVFEMEDDWPISDRKVFYELLNIPNLLRNDVRGTPFENTPECYNDVTDMVTRLRLDGSIPFDAIGDETRPVITWDTHKAVGSFIKQELEGLFTGYWRDLQQSQPNHIESLVEKNTVASLLRSVAAKYTIPMTSGRGYSSLPPRKAMVDRFLASGREKLIIVVVSDFDPEGEDIPNAFGLSIRDDFNIPSDRLVVMKACLTKLQTEVMDLHEGQLAKEKSARYDRFVAEHGDRCWELEAVPTEALREIVERALRSVMDLEAFEAEVAKEQEEQDELFEYRSRARELLVDLG